MLYIWVGKKSLSKRIFFPLIILASIIGLRCRMIDCNFTTTCINLCVIELLSPHTSSTCLFNTPNCWLKVCVPREMLSTPGKSEADSAGKKPEVTFSKLDRPSLTSETMVVQGHCVLIKQSACILNEEDAFLNTLPIFAHRRLSIINQMRMCVRNFM